MIPGHFSEDPVVQLVNSPELDLMVSSITGRPPDPSIRIYVEIDPVSRCYVFGMTKRMEDGRSVAANRRLAMDLFSEIIMDTGPWHLQRQVLEVIRALCSDCAQFLQESTPISVTAPPPLALQGPLPQEASKVDEQISKPKTRLLRLGSAFKKGESD